MTDAFAVTEMFAVYNEGLNTSLTIIFSDSGEAFQIALSFVERLKGAENAADTRITFVIKPAVRNIMFVNKLPNVVGRPIFNGVKKKVVVTVRLKLRAVSATRRFLRADTGKFKAVFAAACLESGSAITRKPQRRDFMFNDELSHRKGRDFDMNVGIIGFNEV